MNRALSGACQSRRTTRIRRSCVGDVDGGGEDADPGLGTGLPGIPEMGMDCDAMTSREQNERVVRRDSTRNVVA